MSFGDMNYFDSLYVENSDFSGMSARRDIDTLLMSVLKDDSVLSLDHKVEEIQPAIDDLNFFDEQLLQHTQSPKTIKPHEETQLKGKYNATIDWKDEEERTESSSNFAPKFSYSVPAKTANVPTAHKNELTIPRKHVSVQLPYEVKAEVERKENFTPSDLILKPPAMIGNKKFDSKGFR
jgi:hypothetical protein